jgi:hypothetical protein
LIPVFTEIKVNPRTNKMVMTAIILFLNCRCKVFKVIRLYF